MKDHTINAIAQGRRLQDENKLTEMTQNEQVSAAPVPIYIDGFGLTGIFIGFMFLAPILILVSCMMDIFVTTKTVEHQLLIGRVELS